MNFQQKFVNGKVSECFSTTPLSVLAQMSLPEVESALSKNARDLAKTEAAFKAHPRSKTLRRAWTALRKEKSNLESTLQIRRDDPKRERRVKARERKELVYIAEHRYHIIHQIKDALENVPPKVLRDIYVAAALYSARS